MPPAEPPPRLAVSAAEISRMQCAAEVVRAIRTGMAGHDGGILGALGIVTELPIDWRHYPEGDIYDSHSHAQYFYHAHAAPQRMPSEQGHFHTFLRAEGMPVGVAPLVLPETAVADAPSRPPQAAPLKRGARDEVSHLVAIGVDTRGEPFRLFTTNRWVTGETWYRAEDVIRMLDCFSVDAADGPPLLNSWIGAVVCLFRPQIVHLLRLRDDAVMGWRRRRRTNVFEDNRLEITSTIEIDLDAQLDFLARLAAGQGAAERSVRPRLQSIEGWGEGHAD